MAGRGDTIRYPRCLGNRRAWAPRYHACLFPMNADMPDNRPVLHKPHPLHPIQGFNVLRLVPRVLRGWRHWKRMGNKAFGGGIPQMGNP